MQPPFNPGMVPEPPPPYPQPYHYGYNVSQTEQPRQYVIGYDHKHFHMGITMILIDFLKLLNKTFALLILKISFTRILILYYYMHLKPKSS